MILLADYIEGAVTIINTISQANDQDFPVAMAEDINLRDGTNVEDRLSGLKNYTHPTTPGYRHIPAGGAEGQILKYKDDGEAEWVDETNTEYGEATPQKAGLMSASDKTKLNGIASGANNYTHPTTAGNKHIPAGGAAGQILQYESDGTAKWATPAETSYDLATPDTNGLMSATDKEKLDGIAANANNYTHPSFTQRAAGLYKVTVNNQGHVTDAVAVAKSDITKLGIPAQDTTYQNASSDSAGLMSPDDKSKLDNIAANANNYTHPSFTQKASGLYKVTVNNQGHVTNAVAVTKADITALGIPGQDTNTTYEVATTSNAGLMSAADKTKLNGIANNANNYTHPNTPGNKHIPAGGSEGQILQYESDGTAKWATIEETVYDEATSEKSGLMSASDKKKLDGIAANANKYTHPSYTQRQSGLYKVTVDNTGHVSAVAAVTKSDITALGIPAQDTNTTYTVATTSKDGLMSSEDKTKLDGIAANANNYSHPSFTQRAAGLYKVTVNNQGHVTNAVAVTKADITALGIPGQDTNTTYSAATTSSAGLMSAADKTKLNGIATNANNYTHPSYTQKSAGIYKFSVDATGHVNSATAVTKEDLVTINPGLQIGFAAEAPSNLNLNDLWIELEGGA